MQERIDTFEMTLHDTVQYMESRAAEPTIFDFSLLFVAYDSLGRLMKERLPAMGVQSFSEIEDAYPCSPMQEGIMVS